MTTEDSASTSTPAKSGLPAWAKKAIGIAVLLVVLVIAYFILAAYLPRAWAQNVGGLANGSFGGGILWGLLFGTCAPSCRCCWSAERGGCSADAGSSRCRSCC